MMKVYRWRLFKYKTLFTEVWDTIDNQWESNSSHSKPPGEVQYILEDSRLEPITRFRNKVVRNIALTSTNSVMWLNLSRDDEKKLDRLLLGN